VRRKIYPWTKGLAFCFLAASLGCSAAPPCPVTPIHIEETREDVKVLERDLSSTRERADELQAKVEPAELRKKLDELKKGSGRIEKEKSTEDEKE